MHGDYCEITGAPHGGSGITPMDEKQSSVTLASPASGKDWPKGMSDRIVVKSALATMGTQEYFTRFDAVRPSELLKRKAMMGDDPALPKMPAAPALFDFFRLRFGVSQSSHLLQRANLALKAGVEEKGVLACL